MMMTIKTPFGIGFATSQEDYDKMMLFLEGVQAGMAMTSQTEDSDDDDDLDEEEENLEAFRDEITNSIDADSPKDWWQQATDLMDYYEKEVGCDRDELRKIAREAYR